MNLIVGLGNPGEKYATTRHNIGFMVVDQVLHDLESVDKTWKLDQGLNTYFFKNQKVILAKPQTFMNASGFAVTKLLSLYKVPVEDLWVVHDDIDLPLGKMRIRLGGGTAGHHGVESIMREVGNNDGFVRFRLGIGRLDEKKHVDHNLKRHAVQKYVVSRFTTHEEGEVRKLVKHTARAITLALTDGLAKTMNQFSQ